MRVPEISTSQNQIQLNPLPTVRKAALQDTRGQSIGAGLQNVGDVVSKIQTDERALANKAQVIENDTALSQWSNSALHDPTNGALNKEGKDAFDLPAQVLPKFDEQAQALEGNIKSPAAKLVFRQSAMERRQQIDAQLNQHESMQRKQYYDQQYTGSIKTEQDAAGLNYQDPKAIADSIARQDAVITLKNQGKPPELTAAEQAHAHGETYANVFQRFLANDQLDQAQAYLKQVRPDITDTDALTKIEKNIQLMQDRRDAKAAIASAKIDAHAYRAVGQMDQQIASGIPATGDMWNSWRQATKGTEYEQDYREAQQNEQTVQTVLKLPIADQLKFIQDKESQLMTGGGSVRDATNINRLKTAITQNVKLMADAPLVFNANRLGEEMAPLGPNDLTNGDVNSVLQDRLTTLQAMRKQYGPQIPLKPLLPQEAQALGSQISQATPAQQAKAFDSIYANAGDPQAFNAIMQQIAPDSPVSAYAGMIYGKQNDITINTHLFGKDDVVQPRIVAQTLLEGERLINKTKLAKSEDGKPLPNLFMPPKTEFDAQFATAVGDTFAGRPDAENVALQVAYAYYVGKSAETGRLNKDTSSYANINNNLMRESLKATLGNVVDYNGSGSVLTPLGMNESTFQDKIHDAYKAALQQRGYTADQAEKSASSDLPNLGLRNWRGDGQYIVTKGKEPFSLKGQPMVVVIQ